MWSLRGGEGQELWEINASQEGECSEQAYFIFTRDRIVLVSVSSCSIEEITFSKQMLHSGLLYFPCTLKLSPSPFVGVYISQWHLGGPMSREKILFPLPISLHATLVTLSGKRWFSSPTSGCFCKQGHLPTTSYPEGMPDADTSGLQLYLTMHICFLNDMQRQ